MGSAAWLLVALVTSADHGFATASISAEVRALTSLQEGSAMPGAVAPQASIQPTLDVGWVAGALRADIGYHPQLTITDADGTLASLTPAILHRMQASADLRLSPSRRALVDQQLSFGQYDTSLGNPGQTGGPPLLLPLGIVDYLTSDTTAGFDGALASRLRLRASAGYHVSGGLTQATRVSLPLEQGPRLTLELEHTATRRDAFSGYLRVSGDRYFKSESDPAKQDVLAAIAEGGVTWRSTLTRELSMNLGAGAAAVASVDVGATPTPRAVPVGAAGLSYGVPRLRFALDASYSPQPDAQTGTIFERAGLTASGEYHPRGDLTARASFGGSWAVEGLTPGDRSVQGEASLAWHEGNLEVSGGLHAANVELSGTTSTELRAFVAFSFKTAAVR
jgi:hypothetical protein